MNMCGTIQSVGIALFACCNCFSASFLPRFLAVPRHRQRAHTQARSPSRTPRHATPRTGAHVAGPNAPDDVRDLPWAAAGFGADHGLLLVSKLLLLDHASPFLRPRQPQASAGVECAPRRGREERVQTAHAVHKGKHSGYSSAGHPVTFF